MDLTTQALTPRKPGRRPRAGTPATRKLWVRVTEEELANLRRVATENGITIADVIRDGANEFVADYDERKPTILTKARH